MTKVFWVVVDLLAASAMLFLAVVSALGDISSLRDLWTFGGPVGMARPTQVCFVLSAYLHVRSMFRHYSGNGGWPFRRLNDSE